MSKHASADDEALSECPLWPDGMPPRPCWLIEERLQAVLSHAIYVVIGTWILWANLPGSRHGIAQDLKGIVLDLPSD
jgi:hypothetical protein